MNDIRKIAFIGAGNMTQSIVGGMCKSGYPADHVFVSNPSPEKLEKMKSNLGVNTSQDNIEVIEQADVIVLSVKPQLMEQVCADIKSKVSNLADKLIITIAAGIRMPKYRTYLGDDITIIRVMPNTPSLVGQGLTSVARCCGDGGRHGLGAVLLQQSGLGPKGLSPVATAPRLDTPSSQDHAIPAG